MGQVLQKCWPRQEPDPERIKVKKPSSPRKNAAQMFIEERFFCRQRPEGNGLQETFAEEFGSEESE